MREPVAGVAVALVLLSGCALGGKACTAMGASSGVNFDFRSALADTAARGATVEACVDAECTTRTIEDRRDTQLFIEDDNLDGDALVPVTLTVITRTGDLVFDGETEVTPQESRPNGPGCEPTVYGAQVTATGSDTLTPQSAAP